MEEAMTKVPALARDTRLERAVRLVFIIRTAFQGGTAARAAEDPSEIQRIMAGAEADISLMARKVAVQATMLD